MPPTRERRELKREYKESRRPMGVFRLYNRTNGKSYVASSLDLPAIRNRLRMELDAGMHRMYPDLQRDWREQGGDAFDFEVLAELEPPTDAPGWDPKQDLEALEQLWLEELSPYGERGYNRQPKNRS